MKRYLTILLLSAVACASAPFAVADSTARPTSTNTISDNSQPTLKPGIGYIEISVSALESEKFFIFSITGQLVKTIDIADSSEKIELPAGCYIVKCDKWSKKVVVR